MKKEIKRTRKELKKTGEMEAEGECVVNKKQVLKHSRIKLMYSKDQDLQSFSELNLVFPETKMGITWVKK